MRPASEYAVIGGHTFGFIWSDSAAGAIEQMAEVGIRDFQILAIAPHLDLFNPGDQAQRIRNTVAACGGRVVAIDLVSLDINLASLDPKMVDLSVDMYFRALDFGVSVGCQNLTVNSGRVSALLPPPDSRIFDAYRGALERIAGAVKQAANRILLENIPGSLLAKASDTAAFLDEEDYGVVDVLFDVTNALAADDDPMAGIDLLARRIKLLHLSDAPRGAWRHDPIGSGDVDFAALHRKLQAVGYSGEFVIEASSPTPLQALESSRRYLLDAGWPIDPASWTQPS